MKLMKNVIITGANGFIGSALVNHLLEKNIHVWAIIRHGGDSSSLPDNDLLHIVYSDYDEYEKLPEEMPLCKYDCFFHLAWEFRKNKLYDEDVQLNNVNGACKAARAAKELNCKRFVFMNSFFVHKKDFYADPCGIKVAADSSVYGKCKACACELTKIICHTNGVEFVSIMLSNIFGRGDKSDRAINTMLRNMIAGRDVPVVEGKRLYDYIYIDDAVEGIRIIAEKGKSDEEYYLGNNALRPFRDFVIDMRDAVNPKADLKFGYFQDTSYIEFQNIDLYKVYRDTGFLPQKDIYDSFRETEAWLREYDAHSCS